MPLHIVHKSHRVPPVAFCVKKGEKKMTEIRGIKAKWEDLSTGSPMNRLFNDFFRLNKHVLGIPNECRDANFSRYAYEQALSFYQMHHIRYGKALAESFINLTKTFPKMVRTFEKDSKEFQLFQVFWDLHRKYVNGDERQLRSDDYWELIVKEVSDITNKYHYVFCDDICEPIGNYVTAILMDFMEELEQRSKEERKQSC